MTTARFLTECESEEDFADAIIKVIGSKRASDRDFIVAALHIYSIRLARGEPKEEAPFLDQDEFPLKGRGNITDIF